MGCPRQRSISSGRRGGWSWRLLIAVALLVSITGAGLTPTPRAVAAGEGLVTSNLYNGQPAAAIATALVGSGVTISNVDYKGVSTSAGMFSGGTGIIGFEGGVVLSTGAIADVVGPNETSSTTTENGTPGDSNLASLAGTTTYDATVLEFDFVPIGDQITFQYVFASEEYREFVGSEFNDVFGFFINGVNCATLGSGAPVAVNSVNHETNAQLFVDNTDGTGNTEMDGLTTALTCTAPVQNGQVNHIELAIADVSDSAYDSVVFLKAGSFTTTNPDKKGAKKPAKTDGEGDSARALAKRGDNKISWQVIYSSCRFGDNESETLQMQYGIRVFERGKSGIDQFKVRFFLLPTSPYRAGNDVPTGNTNPVVFPGSANLLNTKGDTYHDFYSTVYTRRADIGDIAGNPSAYSVVARVTWVKNGQPDYSRNILLGQCGASQSSIDPEAIPGTVIPAAWTGFMFLDRS